ncbi:MAG: response regulator transcription factor [Verrucomicrobia bacterium]|nr:response regulator transcription factor [Verrucomicrobiota bacterium]
MKLLLVEDSQRLQRSLTAGLKRAGYALDVTGDGREGLWFAESNDYDVIILDIMLPGLDGLSLLQRLRAKGKSTHVLLLTARDTVDDRVRGLEIGADDYLVKPFAFRELLARVRALCRRSYGTKSASLVVGDLQINTAQKTVTRAGQPIKLSPREFALLEYLVLRRGQVVSRSEIETHIYDDQVDPMSNVVDSAVCMLRKAIGLPGSPPLVHTRHGLGYVFELET